MSYIIQEHSPQIWAKVVENSLHANLKCVPSSWKYSFEKKSKTASETFFRLNEITVFPIKPWTLKKFSGMLIVSRPTNQTRDETAKYDRQTTAGISHDLIRNNKLAVFLLQEIFNIPFGSLWKSYFLTTNQHQSLDSVCSKPNYRIDLKVSTNCENLQWYRSAS